MISIKKKQTSEIRHCVCTKRYIAKSVMKKKQKYTFVKGNQKIEKSRKKRRKQQKRLSDYGFTLLFY
jgi:hypothetical protein